MAPDTWVAAVPCGFIDNGQRNGLQVYAEHPEWRLGPGNAPFFEPNFDHALIQFWNVQDPHAVEERTSLPPAISPFDQSHAIFIESLSFGQIVFLFVSDFAGRVMVYDVSRILQSGNNQPRLIETWSAPLSLMDDYRNNVYELAVDVSRPQTVGPPRVKVYVYVGVERVGMQILEFDPRRALGQRLREVKLVQTPGNVHALTIRNIGGRKSLLMSDGPGGIRIYEYSYQ